MLIGTAADSAAILAGSAVGLILRSAISGFPPANPSSAASWASGCGS